MFAIEAFDLSERYQTPVIVLLDLDLGMNDWSSKEFEWDDLREYARGKVLSKNDLDEVEEFGRYLDVDGDGGPYRTYPGTHPQKGAYFTRGTSHDEYARYTEDGVKNAEVLSRLTKKFFLKVPINTRNSPIKPLVPGNPKAPKVKIINTIA